MAAVDSVIPQTPAKKRRVLPSRVTFWYSIQSWDILVVSAEDVPQQPAGWLPSVEKEKAAVQRKALQLLKDLKGLKL